jgi:hypothetical protein
LLNILWNVSAAGDQLDRPALIVAAIEQLRADARAAAEASRAFAARIGRERLPAEPETVAL